MPAPILEQFILQNRPKDIIGDIFLRQKKNTIDHSSIAHSPMPCP